MASALISSEIKAWVLIKYFADFAQAAGKLRKAQQYFYSVQSNDFTSQK
jgi:hypothetical protein